MHFKTNEDLIQKQKDFLINFLEKDEGIPAESVIFSEVEYLPLSDFDPLHNGGKKNLEQMILDFSLDTAFPPILVCKNTKLLMDGSHRFLASEYLKYSHIPVLFYSIKGN
jgi:hypothetical protein